VEKTHYRTIVIDPPWPFRQKLQSLKTRGGVKYPTMDIEAILALPVAEWTDKECQLWLWSTNSHLHDAFHCLEQWQFRYITTATWVKTSYGLGYWLRGQTEHVLLGVRGNPREFLKGPHGAAEHGYSTVIVAPRTHHSEKPQAFYDMVEALGSEPRLEVFARKHRLGWDCIGDELGVKL